MNNKTKYFMNWTTVNNLILTLYFVILLMGLGSTSTLVYIGIASFTIIWIIHFNVLKKFRPFAGFANWMTLARLLIVFFIGFQHDTLTDLKLLLLVIIAVSLDGLDGLIARKMEQASSFGAQFDMETDAFYVALMSVILVHEGYIGSWLLPVGFLRYIYGTLLLALQMHKKEQVRTRFARIIAGLFFIALPTPFLLPEQFYLPVIIVASGLIVLSFGWSFGLLVRATGKNKA